MFVIHVNENNATKSLIYNPSTGLFGGIDHNIPSLPSNVTKFCQSYIEYRKNDNNCFSVRIFLGDACNFNCSYCIQNRRVNFSDIKKYNIEDICNAILHYFNLSEKEILEINFMGGEPLLHKEKIIEIVKYIENNTKNSSFYFITNGVLFDGHMANFCIEHNINVILSHDGPGQYLRGKDPLAPRTESYRAFSLLYNTNEKLFSVNPVLTKENFDIESIWSYIENRMHGKVMMSECLPCIPATDDIALKYSLMSEEDLLLFRDRIINLLLTRHLNYFSVYTEIFCKYFDNIINHVPVSKTGRCSVFSEFPFVISLDGSMRRCTSIDDNSYFCGDVINYCGNIIDYYKNNASLSDIEKSMNKKPLCWNDRDCCLKCPYIAGCKGGCPALPDNLFEINCLQNTMLGEAIFTAFLKTMYSDMVSFNIEYVSNDIC